MRAKWVRILINNLYKITKWKKTVKTGQQLWPVPIYRWPVSSLICRYHAILTTCLYKLLILSPCPQLCQPRLLYNMLVFVILWRSVVQVIEALNKDYELLRLFVHEIHLSFYGFRAKMLNLAHRDRKSFSARLDFDLGNFTYPFYNCYMTSAHRARNCLLEPRISPSWLDEKVEENLSLIF